ncbi:unnamed protein product [Didymodactylos carnosus]|uniref:G-protein coupled receptors family 1 profile domain-containing protein n=2 Tax=Didymodactylos carnosus TaxID=1234261 RepID=A0A8S2FF72_9BILA|nr:unnamed protein product [Didymodactylos carnosus]CAF4244294.1 unnamed protein product [Didymodactylos carnosus]
MVNSTIAVDEFDYDKLGDTIGTIWYPIIYTIGFFGNFCSLATFSTKKLRQFSGCIFLLLLSISDNLFLLTTLWYFLYDTFNINLEDYSVYLCRSHIFLDTLLADFSSWCIAGLCCDKFLRTQFIFRAKEICTSKNALKAMGITFVLLCLINGHYLSPTLGQERSNGTDAHCYFSANSDYSYFLTYIWPCIDSLFFWFLPALIMILANIKVIYNLKRGKISLRNHQTKTSTEKQMIVIMFVSVIIFLITCVPLGIHRVYYDLYVIDLKKKNSKLVPLYKFQNRMLRNFNYLNFVINFYLYCLTSKVFRKQFIRVIHRLPCLKAKTQIWTSATSTRRTTMSSITTDISNHSTISTSSDYTINKTFRSSLQPFCDETEEFSEPVAIVTI